MTRRPIFWIVFCALYVDELLGWENLQFSLPHETALIVVAGVGPPLLLWVLLLYFVRASQIDSETERLLRHFEAMTYPADDAQDRVAAISQSLKRQAQELQDTSDHVRHLRAISDSDSLRVRCCMLNRDGHHPPPTAYRCAVMDSA